MRPSTVFVVAAMIPHGTRKATATNSARKSDQIGVCRSQNVTTKMPASRLRTPLAAYQEPGTASWAVSVDQRATHVIGLEDPDVGVGRSLTSQEGRLDRLAVP